MAIPNIIDGLVGDALPVKAEFTVSPRSLLVAGSYGLMVALLFTLWPLGRAEHVRASVLFRDSGQGSKAWPRRAILVWIALLIAALFGLALLTSQPKQLAMWAFGVLLAMLVVFSALAWLIVRIAKALPRPAKPELAIALRNVAASDGLTRSVILSLGTGLSLLVGVALVNASLVEELRSRLPANSPDYFLLDVPKQDYDALKARVQDKLPGIGAGRCGHAARAHREAEGQGGRGFEGGAGSPVGAERRPRPELRRDSARRIQGH